MFDCLFFLYFLHDDTNNIDWEKYEPRNNPAHGKHYKYMVTLFVKMEVFQAFSRFQKNVVDVMNKQGDQSDAIETK